MPDISKGGDGRPGESGPQGRRPDLGRQLEAGNRQQRKQAEVAALRADLIGPQPPDNAAGALLRTGAKTASDVLSAMEPQKAADILTKMTESVGPKDIADNRLKSMEPRAIAAILGKMQEPEVATAIFEKIAPKKAAEVALEAGPVQAASLFQTMELKRVASIFEEMVSKDSGKTARTLEAMEPKMATQVVKAIEIKYAVDIIKEMQPQLAADLMQRVSIDRAKDIIVALDTKAAAGLVEEMAKQWPNRTAHRMEKVPIEKAVPVFEAMSIDAAGKVLAKMSSEQAAQIAGKMNALTGEAAGSRVLPGIIREATEVASRTAEVSDPSQQSLSASDRPAPSVVIRFTGLPAEDAADLFVRIAEGKGEGKGLRAAANLLENALPNRVAESVKHVEDPKLLAAVFREMAPTKVVKVALEADPAVMGAAFDKMPVKKAANILREMAGENRGLAPTARILEITGVKLASRVVKGMETAEAAAMIKEMSAKPAAGIMERVSAYETVRIVKVLGVESEAVRDVLQEMSAKRVADVVASINMLGADQGKFSKMVERSIFTIKYTQYKVLSDIQHKLLVGAVALGSTMVSGAIDQAQIIEQQHGVNTLVIDSYIGGFTGSFLVGNLFYRFTQSWEVPEWVPIVGGKTIGSSPTFYQVTFSVMWAVVGTGVQLVVQPWLSRMGILPPA